MDKIFLVSAMTPFSEDEIRNFMLLTGYTVEEIEQVLVSFSRAGITDLDVVNLLAKLGHFKR